MKWIMHARRWAFFFSLLPFLVLAEATVTLDKAPVNTRDWVSLQRGARLFMNYCLSCHSAAAMRYNGLNDIGIKDAQIKDRLLFAGDRVTDPMKATMAVEEAIEWFGAAPPDLSVEARARGADWLYTYLRTFYADPSRPVGWNNLVFDKVAMPHVLWELQGSQSLKSARYANQQQATAAYLANKASPGKKRLLDERSQGKTYYTLTWLENSVMASEQSTQAFDQNIADLVNFMVWMAEPHQNFRTELGYAVLFFLLMILLPLVYLLKQAYWRGLK